MANWNVSSQTRGKGTSGFDPSQWQTYHAVKIAAFGFPTDVTSFNVWSAFSQYGNIDFIVINSDQHQQHKIVEIRFKLVGSPLFRTIC